MHITADIDLLLRRTSHAFGDALHAVLDGDGPRAQAVLDSAGDRRALVAAAAEELRSHPWVPAPQLAEQLQFVDDLGRVGELVDRLARIAVDAVDTGDAGDAAGLTPARRLELAVLLDAGGRRLQQLLAGPSGPALDPAYRGCGVALFEVADHCGRDTSEAVEVCGALATVLLEASRHAMRAA